MQESYTHYNLLDFLKSFGTTTTTNYDLDTIAYFLDLPIKIIMKDEFKEEYKSENLIINYQNENENGSHWIAFANGYYFDSYGFPPLDEIKPYVKEYNKIRVQPDRLKFCGVLCMYFLYKLEHGFSFEKIIDEMEDLYNSIKD